MDKETRRQVAMEIARQMGGQGRLKAMVNARDWLILEDGGLQFTFSGKRGMNKCLVHYNADDTYTMEFWYCKLNKRTYDYTMDLKKSFEHIYFDMLIPLFEETTGLYLSL